MGWIERLRGRGSAGDPHARRERERAHRQGMRDARQHPLNEFTDPDCQPAYLSELRARAREEIAHLDQGLTTVRTDLLRQAGDARETILRETARLDLRAQPPSPNGHRPTTVRATDPHTTARSADPHAGGGADPYAARVADPYAADPFISIAEAKLRRTEVRRSAAVRESGERVQRARAQIEHLAQQWDSALINRNHAVDAIHAGAERLIAAYRSGVMRAHPRREEIPSLWKGEVVARDSTMDTPAAVSGRQEIGHLLADVEQRIEQWHEVCRQPGELTRRPDVRELPPGAGGDTAPNDRHAGAESRTEEEPHADEPREGGAR